MDEVFEPIMAQQNPNRILAVLFGTAKGSGAALLFFFLWLAGIGVCLIFRADKHIWNLETHTKMEKDATVDN